MDREIFPDWAPPPQHPRLKAGLVDIWRIGLSPPQMATGPSSGPRARAQSVLREILGRYLGCSDTTLKLDLRPGGKPYLAAPLCALEFNLSHCRDLALLAVTPGWEVGIDVEAERTVADPLRLARRVFSTEEVELLESRPRDQRIGHFLALWTRMEARQKATGRGIFGEPSDPEALTSLAFRPDPAHWASLSLSPPGPIPRFRFFEYGRT